MNLGKVIVNCIGVSEEMMVARLMIWWNNGNYPFGGGYCSLNRGVLVYKWFVFELHK